MCESVFCINFIKIMKTSNIHKEKLGVQCVYILTNLKL